MASGGNRQSRPRGKSGMRFTEGRLKGKTVEQATEMGRQMWEKAPASVKERYASRETAMMAPSEQRAAVIRRESEEVEAGMSKFSQGTRRAQPGDTNGDGMMDAAPAGSPAAARTNNPGATPGAGRGTAIKGAATPAENQRAQQIAAEAATEYGASSQFMPPTGAVSTDRAPNPGVVAPVQTQATGRPGPWTAPSPVQTHSIGRPGPYLRPTVDTSNGPRAINPLTGKPTGYVPPTAASPPPAAAPVTGIEKSPPVETSYVPGTGLVPKARPVAEAPMDYAEYDRVRASQDVNSPGTLDPRSPEASAARGRMREFEGQEAAKKATAARLERTGPSMAQVDAQQRQSRRKLDASVARGYGNTRQF